MINAIRRPIMGLVLLTFAGMAAAGCQSEREGAVADQAADAYPEKDLTLIVPFPPGGGTDAYARALAGALEESIGQRVIVRNVEGGSNGSVGTARVAESDDPHTLLFAINSNMTLQPNLSDDTPYELSDFAAVAQISETPLLLSAGPSSPAQNMEELIEHAKSNPNSVTYGTAGTGDIGHVAFARMFGELGIELKQVPFAGAGETVAAVVGGQVDLMSSTVSTAVPHIEEGELSALALSSAETVDAVSDTEVANLTELGIPEAETMLWRAVFMDADVATDDILTTLRDALQEAVESAELREAAEVLGEPPVFKVDGLEEDLQAENTAMQETIDTHIN
jgi:tripartite-type tricarboxylate transporter receptor subunit TctC